MKIKTFTAVMVSITLVVVVPWGLCKYWAPKCEKASPAGEVLVETPSYALIPQVVARFPFELGNAFGGGATPWRVPALEVGSSRTHQTLPVW